MSNSLIDELLDLLEQAPTPWHANLHIKELLNHLHFEELKEQDKWSLKKGQKYFVEKGGSIAAFITPTDDLISAHIVAAHTDSPGFKLKPNPEYRKENMTMFASEIYGAPLLTSWFNRELAIAGKVFYATKEGIESALININNNTVVIPQLAIHLDREANEKGPLINKQEAFSALAAIDFEEKSYLMHLFEKSINKPFEYILSHDLFLYPIEKPCLSKDFITSYRLDNLASVHAAISALKTAEPKKTRLLLACFWDHEEIGSSSSVGAESPFLLHLLERISLQFSNERQDFFRLLSQSICVSVDLAHAANPNFMDKHDSRHVPLLNRGPVIKYNASNRYATNADTSAKIIQLCEKHVIPYQFFVSRNDMPCGSTIGPINSAKTGIETIDIGIPELSMHSARELISVQDHLEMCRMLAAFLQD